MKVWMTADDLYVYAIGLANEDMTVGPLEIPMELYIRYCKVTMQFWELQNELKTLYLQE